MGTRGRASEPGFKPATRGLLPVIKVGGPSAAAPFLIGTMLSKTTRKTRPDLVAAVRDDIRACDRINLFRAARAAMIDRPSLLPLLPTLALPVLVITGSDDFVPVERARAEADMIRGSRFRGHRQGGTPERPRSS